SSEPIEPFEAIKHIFEPVVTKSIEATKPSDLPRLIEILRQVAKEDPTIKVAINEETGENLISGMGELHLEVRENRIRTERGLDIKTGLPIVVYRESIRKQISDVVEGKSPNKHNKFYITVEKVPEAMYSLIKSGELPEIRIKKKDQTIIDKLRAIGVDSKEAIKYKEFYKGNVLVDATRGIVHIGEVIELIADGFEQVMNEGPSAREPGFGLLVKVIDCKLHEDAIHRGPAQVLPAIRDAIKEAMFTAGAVLYEPLQVIQIESPSEFLGEISKLVQNKRGQLMDVVQEGEHITVKAKLPVAEMFGITSELRSATNGRAAHYIVDQVFERIPDELQSRVRLQIRKRKGLREDVPIV
ncbi:elongation factor EF-2, partial [Candidatus Woesearchaeota archaeon]|nr:elongation factor EF-2 [Candidatus Woesearchaeota archaeon]